MTSTLSSHRKAEAEVSAARHVLDKEIKKAFENAVVEAEYIKEDSAGTCILSRDVYVSVKGLDPTNLRNKVITLSKRSNLVGMSHLVSIVNQTSVDDLNKELADLLCETAIKISEKRSSDFMSVRKFTKVEQASTNQIFHVKSKIKNTEKSVPIHFSSSEVFESEITASERVKKYIVIALDREKNTAFMRIMNTTQEDTTQKEYRSTEVLYVFNERARLCCDIEKHVGEEYKKTFAGYQTVITDSTARSGFKQINNFLHENLNHILLRETKYPVLNSDTFQTGNKTLFYLRHLLPPDRFVDIHGRNADGGFDANNAMPKVKALFSDISKIYYALDCLVAFAATMCREVETDANYLNIAINENSTISITTDALRAMIVRRIELECKAVELPTTRGTGVKRLLLEVSLLAQFTGFLFEKIVTKNSIQSDTVEKTLSNMYSTNVSQPDKSALQSTDFGHMLAVRLIQTVDIRVKSSYSNPLLAPNEPNVIISRIIRANSNFYTHSIGCSWETYVLCVMRKKKHIYMHDFVLPDTNKTLNLFRRYDIHQEFPNTFDRHPGNKNDFQRSISVTCDTTALIKLTLNSPCTALQGITIDHTDNTLP